MSSTHTPGPWTVTVSWNPLGYPSYQIKPVTPASHSRDDYLDRIDEHCLNARLMEVASELLEALELTRKNLSTLIAGPHSDAVLMPPWLAVVDAVIVKAKGEWP